MSAARSIPELLRELADAFEAEFGARPMPVPPPAPANDAPARPKRKPARPAPRPDVALSETDLEYGKKLLQKTGRMV